MAGPSKVQFPGQKKQRMRDRGTKRASEGVRKRLEKNLAALLDDPHARMPTVAYSVKRARKDPVQRSLKECAKVISNKNDRKWLGKRMGKNRGDPVARALAGSLHAAHDDERIMVSVKFFVSKYLSKMHLLNFGSLYSVTRFLGALRLCDVGKESPHNLSHSKILSTHDKDC